MTLHHAANKILGDRRRQTQCRRVFLGLLQRRHATGMALDRYIVESDELLTACLELEATLLVSCTGQCASLTTFYSTKITSRAQIFNTKGQSASAENESKAFPAPKQQA
jgi:ribulose 1,5-bisphosphate synthetase/thiazole synthase